MKQKSVFVVSWGYPSNQTKGNPFVEDAVHLLIKKKIKTSVLIFQFKNILELLFQYKNQLTYTSKKGEEIIPIPIYNFPFVTGWLRRKIVFFQVTFRIQRLIKKIGKPDLLQQHFIFHSTPYFTHHIAERFNIPYVLFEHSPVHSVQHFESKFKTFCQPYLTKAVFDDFVKNATARFSRKVQVKGLTTIYGHEFNSFDGFLPQHFISTRDEIKKKTTSEKFTFCCIGTLNENKGTLQLIEAFSKIKMRSECKLIFCGAGPFLEKANQLITALQLQNCVSILGFISRTEVIENILNSDFVVIASHSETFGNTCIEALAHGIPVVSTKCGGPEDIINEQVGILCEKDSIESLTQALEKAFESKYKFSSDEIKSYFYQKYSEEVYWSKLKVLYGVN